LLGGSGSAGPLNDSWIFSGSVWTQVTSTAVPAARTGASLAYDPIAKAVVLVGGTDCIGNCSGWWEYRAGQWSQGAPSGGPPGSYGGALAYDPPLAALVLVGGVSGNGSYLTEEWALRGSPSNLSWGPLAENPRPSARMDAALAFDPASDALVLFGGEYLTATTGLAADLNDTWELGSSGWTNVSPAISPPARGAAALVDDGSQGALVLFGGCGPEACPFVDQWSFGPAQAVAVVISPATCGSVLVAGASYGNGQEALLVNGSYPIAFGGCPGWGLNSISANGGLLYEAGPGLLHVGGSGLLRIGFHEIVSALSVFVVPATCGSVEINGTAFGNRTTAQLVPGNYTLVAPSCPGEWFAGWSAAGNVTVQAPAAAATTLTFRGTGSVAAYFEPASSPATLSGPLVGWFALIGAALLLGILYLVFRRKGRALPAPRGSGGGTARGDRPPAS
ncbi:MAG: hypothetical protein ACYDFT_02940, partial [Thermoplasmata archaeon]